jgi:hypothetical protein
VPVTRRRRTGGHALGCPPAPEGHLDEADVTLAGDVGRPHRRAGSDHRARGVRQRSLDSSAVGGRPGRTGRAVAPRTPASSVTATGSVTVSVPLSTGTVLSLHRCTPVGQRLDIPGAHWGQRSGSHRVRHRVRSDVARARPTAPTRPVRTGRSPGARPIADAGVPWATRAQDEIRALCPSHPGRRRRCDALSDRGGPDREREPDGGRLGAPAPVRPRCPRSPDGVDRPGSPSAAEERHPWTAWPRPSGVCARPTTWS